MAPNPRQHGVLFSLGFLLLLFALPLRCEPTEHHLLELALQKKRQGAYDKAIAILRALLENNPRHFQARKELGLLLAWTQQYDQAEIEYRMILSNRPEDLEARMSLARLHAWQKEYDVALGIYERILQDTPGYTQALLGIAQIHAWRGEYREAEVTYHELLSRGEAPLVANRELGRLSFWQGKRRRAEQYYRKALEQAPDDPETLTLVEQLEGAPVHRLEWGGGYSSVTEREDWSALFFALDYPIRNRSRLFVRADRLERSSRRDELIEGGIQHRFTRWRVWGSGGGTPDADFSPKTLWTAGASYTSHHKTTVHMDYRYLLFPTLSVNLYIPGITHFFSDRLALTASFYRGKDSKGIYTSTPLLRATYESPKRHGFSILYAHGDESVFIQSLDQALKANTETVNVTIKRSVGESLALQVSYTYEDREGLFIRRDYSLSTQFRF